MQPKAYSYIRFSSPEQARGDSYRRQKDAALAYCNEHGLELADAKEHRFFDAGKSAYKGEHLDDSGELARFLDCVNDGTIPAGSYLLVESLDRLSRDKVMVALEQFMGLLRKGIKVVTLSDKCVYSEDSPSIAMQLVLSISVMMRAHEESATKGKRVSAAWKHKRDKAREDKVPLGRACPAWLRLEDGVYIEVQHRVEVIQRIFAMAINGHGQTSISKVLNGDEISVFGSIGENGRNRSGAWGTSSVGKILTNRSVLGEYQPMHIINGIRCNDGEAVTGYYPAIIEEDTFLQAQAARSQRRTSKSTRQSKNFNIWQGIARCRQCGDAMHLINKGAPPKGYTYLQCHTARKGKCRNGLVRVEHTALVFKEILAKVNSMSLIHGKSTDIRKGLEVAEGRLLLSTSKLEQATEAYNAYPTTAGAKLLQRLEAEHQQYIEDREALRQKLATTQVINKNDFFQQLDLVSYEGRAAANSLLKRLGLQIQFLRHSPTFFRCWVIDISDGNASDIVERMLFGIMYQEGVLSTQAFDDATYEKQIHQGELTADAAIREQEDGIDGGWFW